jgi:hypothetical protein
VKSNTLSGASLPKRTFACIVAGSEDLGIAASSQLPRLGNVKG